MKKVLIVCGNGLGSSFIVEMNVKKILAEINKEAEVAHTDLTSAKSETADLILSAKDIAEHLSSHSAKVVGLKQIWQAANPKGHLLTAISFLIPIVCGSGFIIAIGMGLGGTVQDTLTPGQFDVWQAMATLGAKALGLLPVVIAVGISGSIAGKPGIAPGFVVGLAANTISAGFIGGMIGGYIAGYIALAIIKNVKVPDWARGLMPTLIVPFFASIISCLIMVYIIGTPIGIFTEALTSFLRSMGTSSNLVLGAVIGALCIVDFGGPLNKTCFAFVLTLQAQGINEPFSWSHHSNPNERLLIKCCGDQWHSKRPVDERYPSLTAIKLVD